MRIKQRQNASEKKRAVEQAVQKAKELGPIPDPVCVESCPEFDASVGCHRDCQFAPVRLSSEADDYPLETLIAPLVFELKKLGVFYPCWSCEGHNDREGKLWKIPRVWFYSDSVVHLRALSTAINELTLKRLLSVKWQLVVSHSDDDNADTTFSLEPRMGADEVGLDQLRSDIVTISTKLETEFQKACAKLSNNAG